ncbi:MAG: peptidoglycan DD-metalloendopeptidase family protein [Bdellovibrionaceae bacterium]|nr:peptidoglycan DD-metalloendopeptidase family protein [Pseudobdellovibrionaceae bacterium]
MRGSFAAFILSILLPWTGFSAESKVVERVKRDLAVQTQEYQKVLKSLQNINREMKRFVEERSSLDQERILTDVQLKTISEKTQKIEAQLESQRTLLLSKLASIQKFDQQAWLSFLLKAKNSAQLERNMKILGLIGQRDVQAMKDYSRLARDLGRQKSRFTERLTYLNGLQKRINEMEKGLKEQTEMRSQLLSSMKERQQKTIERLRKLQASQDRTSALAESGILDALLGSSFAERKGQLISPVDGTVTQNYGVIRDNEYHLILSHRGWMYESTLHAPVRSVYDGHIVHRGFFPEYGNFVIVDHADHYYSVYAMLSKTDLKVGDPVKEGQTLGRVGTNPFDGRSGLYFEIRHFAETMDPKVWMKGKGYEISNLEWDR